MSISRNAPCPCGSGKKYKQCCGTLSETSASPSMDSATLLQKGWRHQAEGRFQQAEYHYRQVLEREPDNPDALNLSGLLAMQMGQLDKAINLLRQATVVRPGMAAYHSNLGNAWRARGELDQSIACYQTALNQDPGYAKAHNNLGTCLKERNDLVAAERHFRCATDLDSHFIEARLNHARALIDLNRHDEARPLLENLLAENSQLAEAHYVLGKLYSNQTADRDKTIHCYEQAIAISPNLADAHSSLAIHLMMRGDLARAWDEYEWRWQASEDFSHKEKNIARLAQQFGIKAWAGESLLGKALLIWDEQGVGDEILFASCLPDLRGRGARVTLRCEPRLRSLFARSFPWAQIIGTNETSISPDFHLAAGSLPRFFRKRIEQFPDMSAFLQPDPESIASWRNWLNTLGHLPKIGISWRSMVRNAQRDIFYTDLSQWGAIFRIPSISFVNLQYGECEEELLEAERLFGISILCPPGLNLKDDLDDAAALTRGLDLVIAPNTSVFAMAGAVGTPTWLLNLDSDWTMLGTDRMPWFPSVEVFAKSWDEPWEPLLGRVAERLAEWVGRDE